MADVTVRQATIDDADTIHEIDKLCFATPWSREDIRHELADNPRAFYIVGELDDQLVGYAGLWWIGDEGHITNIAVKPGYRNRKIGEGIMGVIVNFTSSKGIRHHTLEVRKSNEAAINLYKKFGFEVEGIRKGYYLDNGEDALIMWRHGEQEERDI